MVAYWQFHYDQLIMKKILGLTRYAVVVPALASILGALLLMAQGSISMVMVVIDSVSTDLFTKTLKYFYFNKIIDIAIIKSNPALTATTIIILITINT
jgi:hypothetical protein